LALPTALAAAWGGGRALAQGSAAIQRCPDPGLPDPDPDHFSLVAPPYLQPGNQACAPCDAPANAASPACTVFRELRRCRDGQLCRQSAGPFWMLPQRRLGGVAVLDRRGGPDSCHLVLFASETTIGVEDRSRRDQRPYWNLAIDMVRRLRQPSLGEHEWLLGINPMDHRSQHQLHLHGGRISPTLRAALIQAGQDSRFRSLMIQVADGPGEQPQHHRFRVRWIADAQPGSGNAGQDLSQRSPFALVSLDAGEEAMPRAAILLSRAAGGAGYHLLYSLDGISAEGLIDFRGACQLRDPGSAGS
jgi:CDP-diacylglycerol pyrophosphatase